MSITLQSLLSVCAVSAVSLCGLVTLGLDEASLRRLAAHLAAFAVGALLGDAFIHLIPETFTRAEERGSTLLPSLAILGGMMTFFVVEKLLRRSHASPTARHAAASRADLAAMNVLGDAIHNLMDGVLIGASYLAGTTLGVSTTVAVLLHEVPQELGDFGILVHSGLPVRKALLVNLASASAAILGTILALWAGAFARDAVVTLLTPMTAGGFVYIAAADLIPELHRDRSRSALVSQTVSIALGIAVMGLLTRV